MSYTELYKIDKNEDVHLYKEYQNSHLGAMFLWRILIEEYFPKVKYYWELLNGDEQYKFWDLHKRDDFPKYLGKVLQSTYDNVVIERCDLIQLSKDFNEFALKYDKDNNSHFSKYSEDLNKMLEEDKDFFGICWNQTSINGNPWTVYEENEDEESEKYGEVIEDRCYNIDKDIFNEQWKLNF